MLNENDKIDSVVTTLDRIFPRFNDLLEYY